MRCSTCWFYMTGSQDVLLPAKKQFHSTNGRDPEGTTRIIFACTSAVALAAKPQGHLREQVAVQGTPQGVSANAERCAALSFERRVGAKLLALVDLVALV